MIKKYTFWAIYEGLVQPAELGCYGIQLELISNNPNADFTCRDKEEVTQ